MSSTRKCDSQKANALCPAPRMPHTHCFPRRRHASPHANAERSSSTLPGSGTSVIPLPEPSEDMVAQGVQAIVIAPADSKALVPVLQRAHDQGIVIVNIDNKLDDEVLASAGARIPFIGPDNRAGARKVGAAVAARLEPGDSPPGSSSSRAPSSGATWLPSGRTRRRCGCRASIRGHRRSPSSSPPYWPMRFGTNGRPAR